MLRPFDTLRRYALAASDGEFGEVREFYFDDHSWTVRYLIVDTGRWLSGRRVLMSPNAFGKIDDQSGTIAVNLTQEKIRDSPPFDSDKPVSRQREEELHRHYDWDRYWVVPSAAGLGAYDPTLLAPREPLTRAPKNTIPRDDPHLRSSSELVNRYAIHAQDGEIGRVYDFIIEDENWQVRYVVIRTGIWFGKDVLLAPEWIEEISFDRAEVFVNLPRSSIKDAPEYDSGATIGRTYEKQLHDYYGRKRYWEAVETSRQS